MIEIDVYRKTKEQLSLSDILYEGGWWTNYVQTRAGFCLIKLVMVNGVYIYLSRSKARGSSI
jgi:hypothetical protein